MDNPLRPGQPRKTAFTGGLLINASFGWQADGRIASVTDNLVPAQGPTSRTAAYTYAATGSRPKRCMVGDRD
jgi:hypothetical protein